MSREERGENWRGEPQEEKREKNRARGRERREWTRYPRKKLFPCQEAFRLPYPYSNRGLTSSSKVGIAEFNGDIAESFKQVIDLIGGIADPNTAERSVVVKVGVFSHRAENHSSVSMLDAIANSFDRAPKIFLAESDNYQGSGSERLQIWKELFTERVVPFNLSNDQDTRKIRLAGHELSMPHILFKPNVLVDTHIVRSFENGSILKNLFGCILDTKRVKYHKVLPTLLSDVYEEIGGVDLAVLDGTCFWRGAGNAPVPMNTMVAGRDAVAVETVGAALAGLDPQKMPVIQEFVKRGLGEGVLENIDVVGASFESLKEKFMSAAKTQKKSAQRSGPQTWGGHAYQSIESLIHDGFFKQPDKRTIEDVVKALGLVGFRLRARRRK